MAMGGGGGKIFKIKGYGVGLLFFFFQYSRIAGISRCFNPFGAVLQIH